MKKSRFSESQIVAILKEAEGSTPFSRTLSRSLILGQRSVYVEA